MSESIVGKLLGNIRIIGETVLGPHVWAIATLDDDHMVRGHIGPSDWGFEHIIRQGFMLSEEEITGLMPQVKSAWPNTTFTLDSAGFLRNARLLRNPNV